jgi:glycosyltransferase involved in cell wall biosynthesis
MSAPAVSILLPAFQAGATLDACLRSVVRQTEPRWECVLVDDGSTDATPDLARAWAARDDRIRVIRTVHRGLVPALAIGLEACRGATIARMDADDVMHRERLAAQLGALADGSSLAAVGCRVRLFPRARVRPGLRTYRRWLDGIDGPDRVRVDAFVECPVVHPTLMVRARVLRELGYRDAGWPEDYDLVLRMLAAGHEIGVVPRRLLAWRESPTRLWRRDARYGRPRITACKAAFLATGFLVRDETYVLCGYGATSRALRKALLAHGKRPSHIVDVHPRRIGETIHGARVMPVEALAGLRGRPIIASVAGDAVRAEIRGLLADAGLRELRDFVCAA